MPKGVYEIDEEKAKELIPTKEWKRVKEDGTNVMGKKDDKKDVSSSTRD